MSFTVRRAREEDWKNVKPLMEALHRFVGRLHEPMPAWEDVENAYVPQMRRDVAEKNGALFVAEGGRSLIGYALCFVYEDNEIELRPEHQRYGYIKDLYVAPAWQKSGMGKALLDASCAYLKAQGVQIARLHVVKANVNAVEFYDRIGFGHDVLLLSKFL